MTEATRASEGMYIPEAPLPLAEAAGEVLVVELVAVGGAMEGALPVPVVLPVPVPVPVPVPEPVPVVPAAVVWEEAVGEGLLLSAEAMMMPPPPVAVLEEESTELLLLVPSPLEPPAALLEPLESFDEPLPLDVDDEPESEFVACGDDAVVVESLLDESVLESEAESVEEGSDSVESSEAVVGVLSSAEAVEDAALELGPPVTAACQKVHTHPCSQSQQPLFWSQQKRLWSVHLLLFSPSSAVEFLGSWTCQSHSDRSTYCNTLLQKGHTERGR